MSSQPDDQHNVHDDPSTSKTIQEHPLATTPTPATTTTTDEQPQPPPPTQNGIPNKIVDDAPRDTQQPIPDDEDDEEPEDGEARRIPDDGSDFEIETEARSSSPPVDDDSVQLNVGCGIPCRFYNHDRCTRGAACGYLHGPDDKSVRDSHGKNVCLYFLLGECKFGIPKCAYSHRKDFLPAGGWWETDDGVNDEKKRIEDEKTALKQAAKERKQRREKEGQGQNHHQQPRSGGGGQRRGGGSGGGGRRFDQHGHDSRHHHGASTSSHTHTQPQTPALPFYLPQQGAAMSVHELAERMQNFGFTERQLVDLANYGVKPWDEGAWTTLNMLYHY
ncbi:hypothetical protein EXIGLDRAFT_699122 [Exidia glandulosa HHB12029]|uniref:C3H1-type domain-containing protein n=1 Tax=Exidia glandulosa HHB12029 TaxID=1314781 RepID=A0A165Q799_EXIGL|nr:hypothetical protein EXIGLDRAFT_699122 [Exidia glandulosa HHB12029]